MLFGLPHALINDNWDYDGWSPRHLHLVASWFPFNRNFVETNPVEVIVNPHKFDINSGQFSCESLAYWIVVAVSSTRYYRWYIYIYNQPIGSIYHLYIPLIYIYTYIAFLGGVIICYLPIPPFYFGNHRNNNKLAWSKTLAAIIKASGGRWRRGSAGRARAGAVTKHNPRLTEKKPVGTL